MHPLINEAVLLVLNHGGTVELCLNKEHDCFEYNLNTGMKSDLSLYENGGAVWAITQYNEEDEEMLDIDTIVDTAHYCLLDHEYAAHAWINVFRKHGYSVGSICVNPYVAYNA